MSKIILGVRFKGGSAKILEIPKTSRSLSVFNMEQDAVLEIKLLRPLGLTNQEIADTLNEKFKNGFNNKPFNRGTVSNLVRSHGLLSRKELAQSDDAEGWLTATEKMAELGVSKYQLSRMREKGELVYKSFTSQRKIYLFKPGYPVKNIEV